MQQARIQIDQHGRFLFPAKIRKKLNIQTGDVFIMRVIDNEIRIISLDQAVDKMQKIFLQHNPNRENIVDDFLAQRKEEAKLEENKFERLYGNNKAMGKEDEK